MLSTVLRRALLSATGLCLAATLTAAQDAESLFQEGIDAYRTGNASDAVELFKDALAQNPSQDEVYAVWSQVEQRVILDMLLERGDMGALAERFLGLAKLGRASVLSDPGGARDVVQRYLSSNALDSERALLELQSIYGEWAVPALIGPMADRSDADTRVLAIKALIHLGDLATPALIQTLKAEDETTRTNAASTLGSIGDVRAAAALAWMAQSDSSEVARAVAAGSLAKLAAGLSDLGARSDSPTDITMALVASWITSDPAIVRPYASGQVNWRWEGGLVGDAVPAGLYGLLLARSALHTALASGQGGAEVDSALAAVHASMKAEIVSAATLESMADDELLAAAGEHLPAIELALARAGAARGGALDWLLYEGQTAAAAALMPFMNGSSEELTALVSALSSDYDAIAFGAAVVLGDLNEGDRRIVDVLGHSLTAVPDRLVFSIGHSGLSDDGRGWSLLSAADVASGLARAKAFPPKDVIVVEFGLGGVTLDTMIFGLRNDPRSADVPLLVVASAEAVEGIDARYGEVVSAVLVGAASWDDVNAAAGDTGAQRAVAMQRATTAARVLAAMPARHLSGVAENAAEALMGGGDDDVKIAVLDLVRRGMLAQALPAIEELLRSGEASTELSIAALDAAARLWAADGGSRGDGAALAEALDGLLQSDDVELVLAAARARGQLGDVGADVG
ncbi:MAG: hypothetical protein DRQ55_04010 [Planctomycetota bacterium]|nr:MAG: hypothetical protein DRQ55_04010 [Planctomycetota bacterium]